MDINTSSGRELGGVFVQLHPQRDAPCLCFIEAIGVRTIEHHGDIANDLPSVVEVLGDHQAMLLVAEIVELKESLHEHRAIVLMMTTQCKFQVTNILPAYPTTDPDSPFKRVVFEPRYDPSILEDQRFCKATPSGRLDIIVDNPQMLNTLAIGDTVYLTIKKAE